MSFELGHLHEKTSLIGTRAPQAAHLQPVTTGFRAFTVVIPLSTTIFLWRLDD